MNVSLGRFVSFLLILNCAYFSTASAQDDPLVNLNNHLNFFSEKMTDGHAVVEELRAGFDLEKSNFGTGQLDFNTRLKLKETNWDKKNGLDFKIGLRTIPTKFETHGTIGANIKLEIHTSMVPLLNKVASLLVENEIIAAPEEDAPFMEKTIYQFLGFLKNDFSTMDQLYVTTRALVGGIAALYETAEDPNMAQIFNSLKPRWEGNGFSLHFKRNAETLPFLDRFLFLENLNIQSFEDRLVFDVGVTMEFKGEAWEEEMDSIVGSMQDGILYFNETLADEDFRDTMLEQAQEVFDVVLLLMTAGDDDFGFGGQTPILK